MRVNRFHLFLSWFNGGNDRKGNKRRRRLNCFRRHPHRLIKCTVRVVLIKSLLTILRSVEARRAYLILESTIINKTGVICADNGSPTISSWGPVCCYCFEDAFVRVSAASIGLTERSVPAPTRPNNRAQTLIIILFRSRTPQNFNWVPRCVDPFRYDWRFLTPRIVSATPISYPNEMIDAPLLKYTKFHLASIQSIIQQSRL